MKYWIELPCRPRGNKVTNVMSSLTFRMLCRRLLFRCITMHEKGLSWREATKSIVSLVYRLRDQDLTAHNFVKLKKALTQYFSSSSFTAAKNQKAGKDHQFSSVSLINQGNSPDSLLLDLFLIPYKSKDDFPRAEHESYISALWKLRDQVSHSLCSPLDVPLFLFVCVRSF